VPAGALELPDFGLGVAPVVAVGQGLDQRLAFLILRIDQFFRDLALGQRVILLLSRR
jgi:hypothetical protein